jgi:DNA polymerase I-like protein with 3'-5' exonuclease and polymerase domains
MLAHQERQAMNSPIQGTVGDLMSLALVNVYLARRLERPHLRFKILMSVHDQILFKCPVEQVEETLEVVSTAMCENCRIPGSDLLLSIDPEVCVRWGEPLSDEDVARYPSLAKYVK